MRKFLKITIVTWQKKTDAIITWKNPKGTVFTDDQAVISFMSEAAWDFWCRQ